MSGTPVTTDLAVLRGWPKTKASKEVTSAQIAAALNLTVFQITARLKGMEGRGLVARKGSFWYVTDTGAAERENPSPSISGRAKRMRQVDPTTGQISGPPDDTNVPRTHIGPDEWGPSVAAVVSAEKRLPEIERQLDYWKERQHLGHELRALHTEHEHCLRVLKQARAVKKRKVWTSRTEHTPEAAVQIFIAPDGREYVSARAYEVADLLVESNTTGLAPVRLRLFGTSATARKMKQGERQAKEAEDRKVSKEQEARNSRILESEHEQATEAHKANSRQAQGHKPVHASPRRQDHRQDRGSKPRAKRALPRTGDRKRKSAPGRAKDHGQRHQQRRGGKAR